MSGRVGLGGAQLSSGHGGWRLGGDGAEKVDEGRILREIWLGGLGIGIRKEVVFKNV